MDRETFATEHAKICSRKFRKQSNHRSPSSRKKCGYDLYDFLKKNKLPLDIRYNQNLSIKENK